jgi:hypothetical protein
MDTHEIIEQDKINRKNRPNPSKPWVILPKDDILITEFAKDIAIELKPLNTIFYRPDLRKVVEIAKIEIDKKEDNVFTGFIPIEPIRFVSIIEEHTQPMVFNREKNIYVRRSLSPVNASIVLASDALIKNINSINRIFKVPMPILLNKTLTFPNKGYDERFDSWLPLDAPEIKIDIPLDEAKKEIEFLYSEFPFETSGDKYRAIAGLITPFCRGLFTSFSTRTPVNVYEANRERSGKDCCAGITGIVYESIPAEDGPLSNGDRDNNSSAEFSKRILSAMINGRTRMHFSNCKGHIDIASFEKVITSEIHTDRQLGGNKELTFANLMDYSLSMNVGTTYTADFANRCRFIRLFLDIEDANSRIFKNPNLWGYVKENRSKILSCIYTLIKNWIDTGMKDGSKPFASFPEWAKVVGGIMEAASYGNPCLDDKAMINIGGDEETTNMKRLYETAIINNDGKWLNIVELHNIIDNNIDLRDLFPIMSLGEKQQLGKQLKRFKGRILSNIKFDIDDTSTRHLFKFKKIVKMEENKVLSVGCVG